MTTGGLSYRRKCDVILLVGLTELKAQVSWIDSETVRAAYLVLQSARLAHPIYICVNLEGREKVCGNVFRGSPP